MADTYQKIFKSDLFTFLVGKDRKAIPVHSAAITQHSKALSALVNNGMAESQTRLATLDDVDEDDFIRFCQFAYTGDYSTPPFTEDEIPRTEPEDPPVEAIEASIEAIEVSDEPADAPIEEFADFVSTKKNKKGKKKSSSKTVVPFTVKKRAVKVWRSWGVDVSQVIYQNLRTLQTNFENRKFYEELPRQKLLDSCEPVSNRQRNYNFTPVFLAHSRLYVFADKYGIQTLQQLVLQKLQQTLARFELYPERIEDVVELVRYAYSDDHTLSDGTDELRALVAVYMASRNDKLDKSDSFLTLLEDGGAFVRDFWLLVRNAIPPASDWE